MNPTILRKIEKQGNSKVKIELKKCHRYNVSVLMNHLQDIEKMISSDARSPMEF